MGDGEVEGDVMERAERARSVDGMVVRSRFVAVGSV